MPPAPIPPTESKRLRELDRYAIIATPPEAAFDQITKLASYMFDCPVALLSFVGGERQWFKSCVGVDFGEGPRNESFCAWALLSDEVMVVPDAMADPRFVDNPLVNGVVGVRFYAGAPLISSRGYNLGTLCIIDTKPHPQGMSSADVEALANLAAVAMNALEARLAAQEAEQTRDLLQTTLASMGDGVVVTDAKSRVTFMNPAAEQLTAWRGEEASGRPIQEILNIVDETSRQPVSSPISEALAQGRVASMETQTILLAKDGRELAVDDSAAPIYRGEAVAGGVIIFRDVTKRREAERALQYSEDQFRTTFAKAPLGLFLTHLDGRFIEANEAYRALTGFNENELANCNFLSLTHPDEIEHARILFRRLIQEEIETYALEKRIFTKNHELRWVRAHMSLLRDAAGKAHRLIGLVEDITARKLADEQFRFLGESIPQMVWMATPDGMLDYVNGTGVQYFATPVEALLGVGWLAWVHPEDQAEAVERWSESIRTGQAYETQFRLKRASDSSWRLHLIRARPFITADGKIAHWFGTCTDVEDQHQAAQAIAEDRKRWRELLLQTPAGVAALAGPEHRFLWANSSYARLLGRPAEALIGKTIGEALPDMEGQLHAKLLNGVYQSGEPFEGRESLLRLERNGALEDVYVNFVYLPTRDTAGEIDGVFVHATDVTTMVAARREIEERELQFRTLAESILHLAWMADHTGFIFWYNQRWYDYTGTQLSDMQGWGWQSVHDPRVLPAVMNQWTHSIEVGEPFEMIFPLKSAAGTFRMFLTRVEPVRDSTGRVVRWFGTNTDITDQQKTEEQLRRINRDLEEFSYVASHDLQEPLRMVNIYTQLLLRNLSAPKEELERYSSFVAKGVDRMERLIQDLLTFSRSVHAEDLEVGAADLSAALEEAMGVLRGRIEELGATINAPALPLTRGETRQMMHVFQNVLSNALKYRSPQASPEIHIAAQRDGDKWIISVRDNGIGFDSRYAERIFGLFKRLHKEKYPGTGLGLAICKRIVERYGGQMWAESSEGQGSTFYFSLPAADTQRVTAPASAADFQAHASYPTVRSAEKYRPEPSPE